MSPVGLAAAHGHDLIVIGYRGHFLGDYFLGSSADRVAHHAHCPVLPMPGIEQNKDRHDR